MKREWILAGLAVAFAPGDAARAAERPIVVDVWPGGKAQGDHGTIGPERVRTAADAPTKDATWITNVTWPTISVFRPDASRNSRVAMVICPGGGYWNLAWDKEGTEVAERFNPLGITGVVLKYRVPRRPGEPEPMPAPGPLLDAQRAVRLVRSRADEWGIDPGRIGIMGFSAGGHLALMTAISFDRPAYEPIDEVDRASCRPDFAVMAYPGYILTRPGSGTLAGSIRVPKGAGPMFLVHASDDDEPGAQPEQSLALYRALRAAGVPAELHIYDEGGHGFGVRRSGRPASGWPERCAEWLRHRGILAREPGNREGLPVDRPAEASRCVDGCASAALVNGCVARTGTHGIRTASSSIGASGSDGPGWRRGATTGPVGPDHRPRGIRPVDENVTALLRPWGEARFPRVHGAGAGARMSSDRMAEPSAELAQFAEIDRATGYREFREFSGATTKTR